MIKKFLLIIIGIVIIIFSFTMPNLLLQVEDLSREKEIFTKEKEEGKIDVQAEKIYLVRFIHDIYNLKDSKAYYDNKKKISINVPVTEHIEIEKPSDELKSEIQKFITNDIIKEINMDDFDDYQQVADIFSSEYTVFSCGLVKEGGDWLGINFEEKTGKIISIDFPTVYLRKDVDIQKQLENYAKYLDLDIIGDWKFEKNNILKSKKAQLIIMLVEKGDSCMLTIAPIEIYEEYVETDKAIRREYEIVESSKKK